MATITETTEIPAAAEKVWAVVTDPSRFGEWQTIHVGFAGDAPETLSEGTEFTQKVTMMGMPGEVKWTVTEASEPTRLALNGAGPMGTTATAVFELTGNGDSTTFSWENGYDGAALAPMASALESATSKAANESLEKLKALVA